MIRALPLALSLTLAVLAPACAQDMSEANVAPDINVSYKRPDLNVALWAKRFEGESREVFASRANVLAAIGLEPGERIADLGAGTGVYTQVFADAVGPGGKVYAVDIAQPFLDFIAEKAAEDGLTNVETVLGADTTTHLADASVDVIFTCDVYHHFEYPQTMNADIARALKPGGEYVIVDFERIPGFSTPFILGHVRAPKETVIEEVTASGFEFVEEVEIEGFRENYFLRFRTPADRPERS
ncbi:MAG: methyltransferase domain-containing protein [Caulobacterales bacterium]|nr:methyltransferase domain-containing protein [Caulobacterales bacterium]